MAGVGDSWGTAEELLHPRDSHGRFRSKWKMAAGVVDRLMKLLHTLNFKTFNNDEDATQYVGKHRKAGGTPALTNLLKNFDQVNADARAGKTTPQIKAADAAMQPLQDDLILNRVVGPEAFGLDASTLPSVEDFTGKLISDKGFTSTNVGTPLPHSGPAVTMVIATPKGTKAGIPSDISREVVLNRNQPLRVTKVQPDGKGGFYMLAVADNNTTVPKTGKAVAPSPNPSPEQPPQAPAAPQVPASPEGGVAPAAPVQAPTIVPQQRGPGRPAGPPPPPRTDGHVAENVGGTPEAGQPKTPEAPAPEAPAPEAPAAKKPLPAPDANRPRGNAAKVDEMRQGANPPQGDELPAFQGDDTPEQREARLQRAAATRLPYAEVALALASNDGSNEEKAHQIESILLDHGNKVHPEQFGKVAGDLLKLADDYRAGDEITAKRRLTNLLKEHDVEVGAKPGTTGNFDPRSHNAPAGVQAGDKVRVVEPAVRWNPPGGEPRILKKGQVEPVSAPEKKATPEARKIAIPERPFAIKKAVAPRAKKAPAVKQHPEATEQLRNQPLAELRRIAKDEGIRVPAALRNKEDVRQHILARRKSKVAAKPVFRSVPAPSVRPPAKKAPVKRVRNAAPNTRLDNQTVAQLRQIAKDEGIKVPAKLRRKEEIRQHIVDARKKPAAVPERAFQVKPKTPEKPAPKHRAGSSTTKSSVPQKAAPKKAGFVQPKGSKAPISENKLNDIVDKLDNVPDIGKFLREQKLGIAELASVARAKGVKIPAHIAGREIPAFIADVRNAQLGRRVEGAKYVPLKKNDYHLSLKGMEDLVTAADDARLPIAKREKLTGGAIGDTQLVTTHKGAKVVHKKDNSDTSDAEQIASELARSMGLAAPRVYRDNADSVVMDFIKGETFSDGKYKIGGRDNGPWSKWKDLSDFYNSDGVKRMAILDFIINNSDRHGGNWMVSEKGDVVPIDHGFSLGAGAEPKIRIRDKMDEQRVINKSLSSFRNNELRKHLATGFAEPKLSDNPLTKQDIITLRSKIEALRPQLERLGKAYLIDNMLIRLNLLEPHAKGKKNLIP